MTERSAPPTGVPTVDGDSRIPENRPPIRRLVLPRNTVLIVAAIVCFILGAIASGSVDGEVLFNGHVWVALGGATFAAAHLP